MGAWGFMWVIYRNSHPRLPWRVGSAPVRSIHGSGVALWIMETSAVPGTQGSQWLWVQEIWLYKESFLASAAGTQGSLRLVFLYFLTHQALKSLPSLGSSSIDQLPITGMWGGRGYGDDSTHYTQLSSIALLPWLPGFPPQAFPTTISSLPSPRSVSPQSTAALALGLLHNP